MVFRMFLQLETKIFNHLPGILVILSGGGQIAGDKDRVRGIQGQRLQRTQIHFAPCGDANLLVRIEETHQTEDTQAIIRLEVSYASSGVPGMASRKFTGMDWGSSSRKARATSIISSSVSPCPNIAPVQSLSPARRAASKVSTRS